MLFIGLNRYGTKIGFDVTIVNPCSCGFFGGIDSGMGATISNNETYGTFHLAVLYLSCCQFFLRDSTVLRVYITFFHKGGLSWQPMKP